jgi:thiosulfate dehydrogenase
MVVLAPLVAAAADTDANGRGEPGFYQRELSNYPPKPSETWLIAYGGRLYDNWWLAQLTDPPAGSHPKYPATGRLAGPPSWRCVACHGWDYKGASGQFGKGLYRTGFPGIASMFGEDPERIAAILRNDTHGYTAKMLPDREVRALALFVAKGQVDTSTGIAPDTGEITGGQMHGTRVFQNVCAVCHDFDGRAWITGEDAGLTTLGAVARRNPWRAFHRVMNGQTAADMPAMRAFGPSTVLDILSYVQTLPEE